MNFNVFLSFGGNIGDTKKILIKSINILKNDKNIELVKISNFYKTSPVSDIKQRYFINCACHIKTSYRPFSLLEKLKKIEKKLGRTPKEKNMPRIIDIDIIFFDFFYINRKGLTIPHKEWKNRLFVLKPLSELQKIFCIPQNAIEKKYIDIDELLKNFKNQNNEKIDIIKGSKELCSLAEDSKRRQSLLWARALPSHSRSRDLDPLRIP